MQKIIPMTETGTIAVLDYITEKEKIEPTKRQQNAVPTLRIMSPSVCDEHVYIPAESISVWGEPGLKALRDALNEAFPGKPAVAKASE